MAKRVTFYTHITDRLDFSCRLVMRVFQEKENLMILLPDDALMHQLDDALWRHQANGFLAHDIISNDPNSYKHAPILLSTRLDTLQPDQTPKTLLNLSHQLIDHPIFDRILELVGADEIDLHNARERFRFYKDSGFTLEHHKMR